MKSELFRIAIVLLIFNCNNINIISQQSEYESPGIKENLPVFHKNLSSRQTFQLSWLQDESGNYSKWQNRARSKVMECLLTPPPAVPFNPVVISEQDRGSYVARKVVLNITGDSRVLGFMLVPKSKGPHPAVLLLHDHGAKFDIGKEKVIEPWDEPAEKMLSARKWVDQCYGGRFIGDELAKKGFICFSVDLLNWSDRGGGGYEGQQALAAVFFNLGVSFAGLIAHEDLRAAEFLASQPEVDPARVVAMGLSLGGFRTWQVAALSPHISAGVSVCWMATHNALLYPGSNQSGGQSAYTMIHPGLSHYLDYPDVASIACPKPMMFCCGSHDDLFPVESINEAYAKMRKVWDSQKAGNNLVTKIYDSPNEFNLLMQSDAFLWLEKLMQNGK